MWGPPSASGTRRAQKAGVGTSPADSGSLGRLQALRIEGLRGRRRPRWTLLRAGRWPPRTEDMKWSWGRKGEEEAKKQETMPKREDRLKEPVRHTGSAPICPLGTLSADGGACCDFKQTGHPTQRGGAPTRGPMSRLKCLRPDQSDVKRDLTPDQGGNENPRNPVGGKGHHTPAFRHWGGLLAPSPA